jgi:hypothetical protein
MLFLQDQIVSTLNLTSFNCIDGIERNVKYARRINGKENCQLTYFSSIFLMLALYFFFSKVFFTFVFLFHFFL